MEMQINSQLIRSERERRAWSQSHLADVSGLGLRTVQRIEANGSASYESALAIAAAFTTDVSVLLVADSAPTSGSRPSAGWGKRVPVAAFGIWSQWTRWMGNTIPTFVAGAAIAAALIFSFNVPAPAHWFDSDEPEIAIESEAFDDFWAPVAEEHLTTFFGERLMLAGIRCRTTICEIRATGVISTSGAVASVSDGLLGDLRDQPWSMQFDLPESKILRTTEEGVEEFRVFLVKNGRGG